MSNIPGRSILLAMWGLLIFDGLAQGQIAVRQPGQPGGVVNQAQRYVSPWSGSLRWLMMDQIKQEIDLVDDQSKKIEQIRQDVQTETKTLYQEMQKLPREERAKRNLEANRELFERTEKRIKDVLLPQQLKRLEQISLQMQMRTYGMYGHVLSGKEMADKLKITDEQKEKLSALQREMQQELAAKYRELQKQMREDAKQRTMDLLDSQQQKQLKEMIGDPFEYTYPQYGGQTEKKK